MKHSDMRKQGWESRFCDKNIAYAFLNSPPSLHCIWAGFQMPAFDSFCLWAFSGYVQHTHRQPDVLRLRFPRKSP